MCHRLKYADDYIWNEILHCGVRFSCTAMHASLEGVVFTMSIVVSAVANDVKVPVIPPIPVMLRLKVGAATITPEGLSYSAASRSTTIRPADVTFPTTVLTKCSDGALQA